MAPFDSTLTEKAAYFLPSADVRGIVEDSLRGDSCCN